jgi:hypothetical protein
MQRESAHPKLPSHAIRYGGTAVLVALLLASVPGCGGSSDSDGDGVVRVRTGQTPAPANSNEVRVPSTRTEPKVIRVPVHVKKECGDLVESGAGIYGVVAGGPDCATARGVAKQWEDECASASTSKCTVSSGFVCTYKSRGYESIEVFCENPSRQIVSFESGA